MKMFLWVAAILGQMTATALEDTEMASRGNPLEFKGQVNSSAELVLSLSVQLSGGTEAVRLTTEVLTANASLDQPLEFAVRQLDGRLADLKNWRLPARSFPTATQAARTLCPPQSNNDDNSVVVSRFKVIISTGSAGSLEFLLRVEAVEFRLAAGGNSTAASVTPLEPRVFHLPLVEGEEYLVRVDNTSQAACSVVALRLANLWSLVVNQHASRLFQGITLFFPGYNFIIQFLENICMCKNLCSDMDAINTLCNTLTPLE